MAEPSTTTINDLPDQILLHILSFLSTSGDAIITSYVSRKWRNLWISTPSLNFHHFSRPYPNNDLSTLRRFASFVDKTLLRRPPNSPLHTFTVMLGFNNGALTTQLHSWIRYAVSHDVETLHLGLERFEKSAAYNPTDGFEFHFRVLRDSRVRVLKLDSCYLSFPPAENVRFDLLRSVELRGVRVTGKTVADLVVACVNLESLVLNAIQGCKNFKICSSKLKELTIELMRLEDGSIEIIAPNLCVLDLNCYRIGNFVMMDSPSLVEANVTVGEYQYWVKVMSFIGNVQRLQSPNLWRELAESKGVYSRCFMLLNLKHVQLRTSYTKSDLMGISLLLVLSPNLETMILDNCSPLIELMSDGQMTEEIISEDFFTQHVFNVQSLRHVKMKSFVGTECEKNFVIFLMKTAVILESIMLIPENYGEVTPRPPIVLHPQLNSLQDLEYVVRQIPRWRKPEDE